MLDPITTLLAQHREIMDGIAPVRAAVAALEMRGNTAVPEALPAIRAAVTMMETTLFAHAHREDEALFPALEQVFGSAEGPTAVMRMEHRAIHDQVVLLGEILRQMEAAEGGALLASGAKLHDAAQEIIEMLDGHFGKEEQVLFPMARQVLTTEDLDAVARKMEELDRR